MLNRDIQELHAGYINFANALAFRLFGDNLLSLRYPLFGMGVLGACLVFLLLMRHGALMAAVASLSFSSLSVVQFLNPTPHWYCLFLVLLIIAVLTWLPRDSPWRLEILGFLVVTVLLFRQLTGVLTAIGLLAYLLAEAPRQAEGKGALLSHGDRVARLPTHGP